MASHVGCENSNNSLTQLSWADTLTDFLKHVQISNKPLSQVKYTPAKVHRIKLDVPKETTKTEARKLIRTEKFYKLNNRKQDKIIELKIQEFKESLEKSRNYYVLGLDSEDCFQRREKKTSSFDFAKVRPVQLPKRQIPTENKLHVKTTKNVSVERPTTYSTKQTLNKAEENKIKTNYSSTTNKESEKMKELQPIKKKEILLNKSFSNERKTTNNDRLKIKNAIKGKNLFISNYVAHKKKQYYFSKWKLFILSQRNKRDEEKKWREKINNFMQRLQDRSNLQTIAVKQEAAEKCFKLQTNKKSTKIELKKPLKSNEKNYDHDLEIISKETKKSRSDTQHHLRPASVKSLHPNLKVKAKLIRLITAEDDNQCHEISDCKEYPNPEIQLTMDQKQNERRKRLAEIQEKKRVIEEEKDKMAKEKYEQQLLEAELEKKRKFREFREKLKKEQMEQDRRKEEWKMLKELNQKAINHYNNKLKRRVMDIWCHILQQRQGQREIAERYNEGRVLKLIFIAWQTAIKNIEYEKSIKAVSIRARHLKMRSFMQWKELMIKRRFQLQVAEDWNDYLVVRTYFRAWLNFIFLEQKMQNEMWDVAVTHYKKKLMTKTMQHWMLLPQIIFLEREKEYRKQEWREKVQQVLPDFRPIISAQI